MTTLEARERETRERVRVEQIMREPTAVFVFGSNLAGVHGGGAAMTAYREYGAKWGHGEGLSGCSYAIPTKDGRIDSLKIGEVAFHVERFLAFAITHPEYTFAVTQIGCGLAGFTAEQIAPLFEGAPANCQLPEGWRS